MTNETPIKSASLTFIMSEVDEGGEDFIKNLMDKLRQKIGEVPEEYTIAFSLSEMDELYLDYTITAEVVQKSDEMLEGVDTE